jgi:hypothetical protein
VTNAFQSDAFQQDAFQEVLVAADSGSLAFRLSPGGLELLIDAGSSLLVFTPTGGLIGATTGIISIAASGVGAVTGEAIIPPPVAQHPTDSIGSGAVHSLIDQVNRLPVDSIYAQQKRQREEDDLFLLGAL